MNAPGAGPLNLSVLNSVTFGGFRKARPSACAALLALMVIIAAPFVAGSTALHTSRLRCRYTRDLLLGAFRGTHSDCDEQELLHASMMLRDR
jgi:hypothetical protein